jgi:hypothetical protein
VTNVQFDKGINALLVIDRDYETWRYVAPIQQAAWSRKTFEHGSWGAEIRSQFEP